MRSEGRVAYRFRQSIDARSKPDPESDQETFAGDREGLILVSSRADHLCWCREIAEHEVDVDGLGLASPGTRLDRSKLWEEGRISALTAFGLDVPMEVVSDPRNTNPGIGPGTGGDLALALPIDCHMLYLPTIVPSRPSDDPRPGDEWEGAISTVFDFGEFEVSYRAELHSAEGAASEIDVAYAGDETVARAEHGALFFRTSGRASVTSPLRGRLPVAGSGEIEWTCRGLNASGTEIREYEALRGRMSYQWRAIPLDFDEEAVWVVTPPGARI